MSEIRVWCFENLIGQECFYKDDAYDERKRGIKCKIEVVDSSVNMNENDKLDLAIHGVSPEQLYGLPHSN